MAITKSAKKALRQSERKRVQNLHKMKKLKALLKEVKSLVSEIERHFDDVLRFKLIKIVVSDGSSKQYECQSFNYAHLTGVSVKKEIFVQSNGGKKNINVDLKILEIKDEHKIYGRSFHYRRYIDIFKDTV